jgi:hypothetical protein
MSQYSNTWDQFKSSTTLNPSVSNNKYYDAYKKGETFLTKPDTSNPGTLWHNNMGKNVLDEHIVEYKIMVDSKDRDITKYPNPYSYKVTFNPISGETDPVIDLKKKNIKYIKLETICMPQFSQIKEDPDNPGYWIYDVDSARLTDRYTIFDVKEFHNLKSEGAKARATNLTLEKSFGTITMDKLLGTKFFTGNPFCSKIFTDDNLYDLNSMTIKFYDSFGDQLSYTGLDTSVSEDDVRHPLHKYSQNSFTLLIGVVEAQLNTNVNFSR